MAAQRAQRDRTPATPAMATLTRAGVAFAARAYDHDPAATSYGEEAAHELGVEPDRVFKTLVASVDGQLTVAVVPVSRQLDLRALALPYGGIHLQPVSGRPAAALPADAAGARR